METTLTCPNCGKPLTESIGIGTTSVLIYECGTEEMDDNGELKISEECEKNKAEKINRISRHLPEDLSYLVDVQPMHGPVGEVFKINFIEDELLTKVESVP